MQRVLAVCATVGLAGAFRVNPKQKSASLSQEVVVEEKAPRAFCSLSGDPHILTFDTQMRGGPQWHPMHAPGHWWLVKSKEGKVMVQATYGECGLKHGGGWMAARLNGVPRTCMTGIAVGGSFIGDTTPPLIVQVPCDWDWENSKCRNTDTQPRITWQGQRVSSVNSQGVTVSVNNNHINIKLPQDMEISLHMGGKWNGAPFTYMDARIFMVQGTAGEQCGHCGNYDGNRDNDAIYEQTGKLKVEGDAFCDADVACKDRMIPGDATCGPNKDGTTFTLEDCPEDIRTKAEQECREKFEQDVNPKIAAKLPGGFEDEELNDCIMDACLDEGFVDDDAADAAEEDAAEIKAGIHR